MPIKARARAGALGAALALAGAGLVGCSGPAGSTAACPDGLVETLSAAVTEGATVTITEAAASTIQPASLAPLSLCTLAVSGTSDTTTAKGTIFFTASANAEQLDTALTADGFTETQTGSGTYVKSDTENAIVVPVGSPEKTGAPDVTKYFTGDTIMVIVSSTSG